MILLPVEGLKEAVRGINVTGLYISPRSSEGLGSSTCMDLFGSGCVCGSRFSGSGLGDDTRCLEEEKGFMISLAKWEDFKL